MARTLGTAIERRSHALYDAAMIVAALAVTAALAAPAWSPTKAAARVQSDVRVPWCRVYPDWKDKYGAPFCSAGKAVTPEARAHEPLRVTNVVCTGTGAGTAFRQLRCDWHWNNSVEHGTLLVYVTGPATFRWRSL